MPVQDQFPFISLKKCTDRLVPLFLLIHSRVSLIHNSTSPLLTQCWSSSSSATLSPSAASPLLHMLTYIITKKILHTRQLNRPISQTIPSFFNNLNITHCDFLCNLLQSVFLVGQGQFRIFLWVPN